MITNEGFKRQPKKLNVCRLYSLAKFLTLLSQWVHNNVTLDGLHNDVAKIGVHR